MPLDLDKLSDDELRKLMEHARAVVKLRFSRLITEWSALAQEAGYELIVTKLGAPGPAARPLARTIAAKYRNPNNESETWAGRGKQPNWLKQKLKAGRKLEEFRVTANGGAVNDKRGSR